MPMIRKPPDVKHPHARQIAAQKRYMGIDPTILLRIYIEAPPQGVGREPHISPQKYHHTDTHTVLLYDDLTYDGRYSRMVSTSPP